MGTSSSFKASSLISYIHEKQWQKNGHNAERSYTGRCIVAYFLEQRKKKNILILLLLATTITVSMVTESDGGTGASLTTVLSGQIKKPPTHQQEIC